MARILIGWETGAGYGHVAGIRLVARALQARRHEVILALRNVIEVAPMLKHEPYRVLQGPHWPYPAPSFRGKPFSAANFADILAVSGYANVDDLMAMVRAWDGLIDLTRPDLVLAEYAPTLCLTAAGRIPAIPFGNGFTTPPANLPVYPPLQPNVEPVAVQEKVLAVIQEVQRRRRAPLPKTLPEFFAGARRFPCTFPELDPYRAVRREPVIPPLSDLPPPMPLPAAARFFAYLGDEIGGLPRILSSLVKSGIPGVVYVRRLRKNLKDALKKSNLTVYDEPVPLPKIFPDVSLVIHLGGTGTAEACLTAGRVQLLFPQHLEHGLTDRALRELGVGFTVGRNATEEATIQAVRRAAGDAKALERAQAVARAIDARGPRPGVAPIVDACEELLAPSRPVADV